MDIRHSLSYMQMRRARKNKARNAAGKFFRFAAGMLVAVVFIAWSSYGGAT